jgi:cyclic-di-AMP phosphodiesterase PgpH
MINLKESRLNRSTRIRILIGLVTVILIVLMFPKGESIEWEVTEGSIWLNDDLIAPFSFPINKDPEVYRQEIKQAGERVYTIFVRQEEINAAVSDSLLRYNSFLVSIIDSGLAKDSIINPTFLNTQSFMAYRNVRRQERNMGGTRSFNLKQLFSISAEVLNGLLAKGVIVIPDNMQIRDSIAVRTVNIDRIEARNNFLTVSDAQDEIRSRISSLNYPADIEAALINYTLHFLRPNIIYNAEATTEEIQQAQNMVSRNIGIVNENERIIGKHDRVTRDAKLKIESYKEAKGERIGDEGLILQHVGKFLHIAFLISMLSIYLSIFRKKIYYENHKLLLIAILFIFLSFVTYLVNQMQVPAPIQFLIFVPVASMLFTIIFDSRVGFYSTVILCLILGALRGNDYSFATMNIFAGALSVYTVRDIKNRSQIFRSFLFILLAYFVAVLAFGLERFATFSDLTIDFAFAGTNALISPVLTYGLLIFFERFFSITTDLTLLELSNLDRPLLKELARKAQGTFNHSMTIGTMAEIAAESVGANPLLARVGSLYHDIGKTITPENFVENQLTSYNIHENLTPEESIKYIIRHVKEGEQLARVHKLPQEIIDFIPMHHGTSTISYFYDKALKLYGEENVRVEDYKYPGPKPNSKETAIVMLGDGCESAVRSITEPDRRKVENMIEKIVQTRIDEGELDESPLTFSDVKKIKEAFINFLLGQHHQRVRYPRQDEMERGEKKKPAES